MDKVLITGASGFIGSFLVEEALRQGFEVLAGVRKTSSHEYLRGKDIKFVEMNLLSQDALVNELSFIQERHGGLDYVIHNAGVTHAARIEDFMTVNYQGTCNLVNGIRASGVQLKKFIHISSLAALGPGDSQTFKPIKISDVPRPISTYGRSKLLAEQYVRSASAFPHIIFNPTAVYGPRDKDFLALMKMINGGLELYVGRSRQQLSFIYVKDLARAVVLALKSEIENASYLISDGREYGKEHLGEVIRDTLHRKTVRVNFPAAIVHLFVAAIEKGWHLFGRRPFLNSEKFMEMTSANWGCQTEEIWRDLGSSPEFSLERGVEETLAWYKQNGWLK